MLDIYMCSDPKWGQQVGLKLYFIHDIQAKLGLDVIQYILYMHACMVWLWYYIRNFQQSEKYHYEQNPGIQSCKQTIHSYWDWQLHTNWSRKSWCEAISIHLWYEYHIHSIVVDLKLVYWWVQNLISKSCILYSEIITFPHFFLQGAS